VISPTQRPHLTTHNSHKRERERERARERERESETYMLLTVFEPTIPASERTHTQATRFGTEVANKRKMKRVHKILPGISEGKRTLENLGID